MSDPYVYGGSPYGLIEFGGPAGAPLPTIDPYTYAGSPFGLGLFGGPGSALPPPSSLDQYTYAGSPYGLAVFGGPGTGGNPPPPSTTDPYAYTGSSYGLAVFGGPGNAPAPPPSTLDPYSYAGSPFGLAVYAAPGTQSAPPAPPHSLDIYTYAGSPFGLVNYAGPATIPPAPPTLADVYTYGGYEYGRLNYGGAGGPSNQILSVYPNPADVIIGNSLQFGVVVLGFTGGITWSLSGPGTISSTGLYSAPAVGTLPVPNSVATTGNAETVLGTAVVTCASITNPSLYFNVNINIVADLAATTTAFAPGVFGGNVWGEEVYAINGLYEPPGSLETHQYETLIDAIIGQLQTFCGSLVSWIGTGIAPPGTPSVLHWPYATVHEISEDRQDSTTSGDYIAHGILQVSVFAHGKVKARNVSKIFSQSLNDAPLIFDDGQLMKLRQSGRPIVMQDPAGSVDGNDIWHEARTYNYQLSGNYAAGN